MNNRKRLFLLVSHRIAAARWSYEGGVSISQNLLILSEISMLIFTAAKAITVGKVVKRCCDGKNGYEG